MNPLPFDYQAHGKKHGIFAGEERDGALHECEERAAVLS